MGKTIAGSGRWGRRLAASLFLTFAFLVALPPYAWPIRGRVSSAFFFRHKPDSNLPLAFEFYGGLDIAAPTGTPIHASAPGIVTEVGSSPDLGNFLRVTHLFGLVSLGAVGSTGRATGPHLHFAIRAGRTQLPPRLFLAFHSLRRSILGF